MEFGYLQQMSDGTIQKTKENNMKKIGITILAFILFGYQVKRN